MCSAVLPYHLYSSETVRFQVKSSKCFQNYLASCYNLLHNDCGMTQAIDVTGELLKSVSRSFYLTIRFLPKEMRPAVALGYMLARATDSVADTASAPATERDAILALMAEVIAGKADEETQLDMLSKLRKEIAPAVSHPAEQRLLKDFGDCLQALATFDSVQQALIRKVLATIIQGQRWDLSAFSQHDTVQNDDETRQYTYMVAGCVGEFWTELGYAVLQNRFCAPERQEIMTQAGIRYGRGLQLINILRDMQEDAERGRHYLCSEPSKWLSRADSYMNDGLDYSRRLGLFSLRFASMLPALIGKRTIQLLQGSTLGKGKVKIKRRVVYACMLKALMLSLCRKG